MLKETNGNDAGGKAPDSYNDWDYRGWLQHQQAYDKPGNKGDSRSFYKTFYNICMWLDIFYDTLAGKDVTYEEYMAGGRFDKDILRKNLSKTAIVNLKKTWGGASTGWVVLNSYLQSETALKVLRKEIEYINADLVICGSRQVFDFAKKIFSGKVEALSVKCSPKSEYFRMGSSIFLDFFHPADYYKGRKKIYENSAETFRALHTMSQKRSISPSFE